MAAALLVSGCGGSTGAGTTGSDATDTSDAATEAAAGAGDAFGDCNDASLQFSGLDLPYREAINAAAASGPIDYEQVLGGLEGLINAAPSDIRADFEAYADEVVPFLEGLAGVEYNPAAPRSNRQIERWNELADQIDSDVVREATANIHAWFAGDCGSATG